MDNTLSVSKGCFVFNNTAIKKKSEKKVQKAVKCRDPWYLSYQKSWNRVEEKLESLHHERFSKVLYDLIEHLKTSYKTSEDFIQDNIVPTAALLTGINMPDHAALFSTLVESIHEDITPYVAMLHAKKCSSIRTTVEQMVSQFMKTTLDEDDIDSDEEQNVGKMKKSQCNLPVLSAWYNSLKSPHKSPKSSPRKRRKSVANEEERQVKKQLVVIIPDFENFSPKVLQDLILIISGYTSTLPVVLVLGVATTVAALHRNLPYHVSARMCIQIFQAPPSIKLLNQVLEEVIFDPVCPFHLGSKTFRFLIDVFLFFDFSVKGFIQGFKFCMMEHFCGEDWKALCCPVSELKSVIASLDDIDLKELRKTPSFHVYLENLDSVEERTDLQKDDELFKKTLLKLMKNLHEHLDVFHMTLGCLNILIDGLPKNPLGTQIRELYGLAVSMTIVRTPEFKEGFQLLGFQSRDELLTKLGATCASLDNNSHQLPKCLTTFKDKLLEYKKRIEDAGVTVTSPTVSISPRKVDITGKMNRFQFKDRLLELSKQQKRLTEFEVVRKELLDYLSNDALPQLLSPPTGMPMAELLFFDNMSSVRAHIVGSPRAAIHTALNDPQFYLQCECCKQPKEGSLLATMPDLSIAYKLYLECGRFINLYDWLQAFIAVVSPSESCENQREVDPCIQARFTRAVAELQFLGFMKSSNRKMDHVTKLT